jgi:hypothetical protein
MRQIEKEMLTAIKEKREWVKGNTAVFIENAGNPFGDRAEIYLHGQHIADYWYEAPEDEKLDVDEYTLFAWPTNTTKSRLRALGADVYTKDGVVFSRGQAVQS